MTTTELNVIIISVNVAQQEYNDVPGRSETDGGRSGH